jgi:hypothetical protein
MYRILLLPVAAALLAGCAAFPSAPPEYFSCAGGEKYKVCKRLKYCPGGGSVFISDHIHEGRVLRTEAARCGE